MNKKNGLIIFIAGILLAFAISALGIERMKVTRQCRDQRLYMDGTYFATIQTGGLNPHSKILVYKQVNMKKVKVTEEDVVLQTQKKGDAQGELYHSPRAKLFIQYAAPSSVQGSGKDSVGTFEANFPHDKISAKIICAAK